MKMVNQNAASPSHKEMAARIAALEQQVEKYRSDAIKYQTFFNAFPHGITISDRQGRIIECNAAAERLLGIGKAEHESRSIDGPEWRIIRADGSDLSTNEWPSVKALEENRLVEHCEMGVVRSDDSVCWLDVAAVPLPDPWGVVITYSDISPRMLAQASLLESQERMRLITDNLPDSFLFQYTQNEQGARFLFVSSGVEKVFPGIYAQDIVNDATLLLNLIEPDQNDRFQTELATSARRMTDFSMDLRARRLNGKIRWFRVHSRPRKTKTGHIIWDGMVTDISDRKQAEEARQYQEWLLRDMGTTAKVGGWEFDPLTGKGSWTEEVSRIHGLDPDIETDMALGLSFYHGTSREKIEHALKAALEHGEPYDLELELVTAGGVHKWVHTIAKPKVENGMVVQVRGSFQDITDRKEAEAALRKSEDKFRQLFDSSPIGKSIIYASGAMHANTAFYQMLGYAPEEFDGVDWLAFTHPDDLALTRNTLDAILSGEKDFDRFIKRYLHKDGTIVWADISVRLLRDGNGNTLYLIAAINDITKRKRAEAALQESEGRLRTLIDALPDLVWLKNLDGVYLACNARFEKFLGAEQKDIVGKDDYNFMSKELADGFRSYDKIAIDKGIPSSNEEEVIFKDDGHREVLETIKTPMYRDDGQLIGVLGIGRDITGRKLKEKIQSAKLRLIDFAATHSNTELLQRFLDEAEALTESSIGFYHFVEDDQKTLSLQTWSTNTMAHMCQAQGAASHYPVSKAGVWVDCVRARKPVVHNDYAGLPHKKGLPDGHAPVIRELVFPVIRNQKIRAILGVGNKATEYTDNDVDIVQQFADLAWETIETKRAEDAQRESEEKYQSMMEAMNDAAYICSSDLRLEYLNPAMIRRIGRDATGDLCHKAINSLDERCPWCTMDRIQQGSSTKKEIKSPMDSHYYQVSNSPIVHRNGTISKMTIYTDITQIKEAEEHLRQIQKMESLGSLAGGIAHDFNNILFPIIGLSELLMMDLPEDSCEHENANDILKSAHRASDLVQQILSFSRQSEKKQIPIKIQQILKEVFKLMRSTIPSNISIKKSIQQECGKVLADPTQIHQIAMNLVTNAYHALGEDGGEILLALEEKRVDPSESIDPSLKPGRYAMLSVADNGIGIEAVTLEKIFDPYFTTKPAGKGTGLGLSVVYGIVKDHGGHIQVLSLPGEGTTFNVYLPVIAKEEETAGVSAESEPLPGGTERILLVDDEEAIIKIEKLMLERLGYQVASHISSLDALEVFKTHSDAFDLVITDMTMPDMTGGQLVRAMAKIRPDIPIVICTGFSEKMDERQAVELGINGLLMKPVLRSAMAKMVRKVLDEGRGANS